MPPTSAREADSDQAAHRPTSAVNTLKNPGGMRAGDRAIVIRDESGRLIQRDTGPSVRLASDSRRRCLASRRSSGVSMSCHQPLSGRDTARSGATRLMPVTAPASEWSPASAADR
jgi:hypothetical protein